MVIGKKEDKIGGTILNERETERRDRYDECMFHAKPPMQNTPSFIFQLFLHLSFLDFSLEICLLN